ncbi:hypothetical protein [Actinokineospora inagensis]|uniref:hypothetical protein n=1 Tax=Actinokineospora inagensis TaxID=103730 RepID=UPI0004279C2D|nr:hypothetical protein [Actinokineospora inagensis]
MAIAVERTGHALVLREPGADEQAAAVAAGLPAERHRTAVVVGASAWSALSRLDPWLVADLDESVDTGVRLLAGHASAMSAGEVSLARRLADRLGVEVIAPDGELYTLDGGHAFAGGAGWVAHGAGSDRRRLGHRFPEPWWQGYLPEGHEQIPLGLWVREPGGDPRADDPLRWVPPDPERPTVVVGAPGEPNPEVSTVVDVLESVPADMRGRVVLACYGADMAQAVARERGTAVRALHGLPSSRGLVRLDESGRFAWYPFAVESVYRPGCGPVLDRWIAPAPTMAMITPARYRLAPGWSLDILARGLLARPDTLPVDPTWQTPTSAVPDLLVACGPGVPTAVLTALTEVIDHLPESTRSRLRIVAATPGATLPVRELRDHVAGKAAVPAEERTSRIPHPGMWQSEPLPSVTAGASLLSADTVGMDEEPAVATAGPESKRLPLAPSRVVLPVADRAVEPNRSVEQPKVVEEPVVAVVAAESRRLPLAPSKVVLPVADRVVEPIEPVEQPEVVEESAVAVVAVGAELNRLPLDLSRVVLPVADTPVELARPVEQPKVDEELVGAGSASKRLPLESSKVVLPVADRAVEAVGRPEVVEESAVAVGGAEVKQGPTELPLDRPKAVLPVADTPVEQPKSVESVEASKSLGGGLSLPLKPSTVVALPSLSAASAVPSANTPQPDKTAEDKPVLLDEPVVPADARSSEAQRRAVRAKLGTRYDSATRAVVRLLAERPGLRAAADHAALLTELAVVRVFAEEPGPYDTAFHTCLTAGLRRLPTTRGIVVAGGRQSTHDEGALLHLPGPMLAVAAVGAAVPGEVELLIWTSTARRLEGLLDNDRSNDVVLPAHTALRVLARAGDRLLLAEDGAPVDRALTSLRAAASARAAVEVPRHPNPARWFGALPAA